MTTASPPAEAPASVTELVISATDKRLKNGQLPAKVVKQIDLLLNHADPETRERSLAEAYVLAAFLSGAQDQEDPASAQLMDLALAADAQGNAPAHRALSGASAKVIGSARQLVPVGAGKAPQGSTKGAQAQLLRARGPSR